jgi:hypothetical protein
VPQRKQHVSITNMNWLMLFKDIMLVLIEIHIIYINRKYRLVEY